METKEIGERARREGADDRAAVSPEAIDTKRRRPLPWVAGIAYPAAPRRVHDRRPHPQPFSRWVACGHGAAR